MNWAKTFCQMAEQAVDLTKKRTIAVKVQNLMWMQSGDSASTARNQ
ncbi:MAG: hypothetical protein U0930_09445 [Pirellulales bacterium]